MWQKKGKEHIPGRGHSMCKGHVLREENGECKKLIKDANA